ncbi:hypothetical protein B0H17DRAFT_1058402 [Mycena rosella]|uniref:Uncharacterized protein n=1 Tax=Mycena rosella TaxID=1033263 RepID=A0AAD7DKD8_MYCRO|nr:hypothetical protein B0H17DRAFT_1058402 [Mycena rosella]
MAEPSWRPSPMQSATGRARSSPWYKPWDTSPAQKSSKPEHTMFGKLMMKNLPEMLAKRVVVGNWCEVLANGLAGIPEALERFGNAGVSGVKLVAHPQDPVA